MKRDWEELIEADEGRVSYSHTQTCIYWTKFTEVAMLSVCEEGLFPRLDARRRAIDQVTNAVRQHTTCIWAAAKLDLFGGTPAAGASPPSAAIIASSQVSTPFNHGPKAGPKTLRCGMLTGLVPIIIGSLYQ